MAGKDNIISFSGKAGREASGGGRFPIGLALGSGAVRGVAHVGVMSGLSAAGIGFRELSGSSIGAVIACLYSAGMSFGEMEETACRITRKMVFDARFPLLSFYGGRGLERFLRDLFVKKLGVTRLEDLEIKVFVTAADIIKGRPVIFSSGSIVDALMASCAVPMLYPPREYAGLRLADGGTLLPVPASLLRGRGNGLVVSVDLGFGNMRGDFGDIFRYAGQTIVMMGRSILAMKKSEADVVIEPEFGTLGYWEFEKIEELLKIGRNAGEKAAADIVARLFAGGAITKNGAAK